MDNITPLPMADDAKVTRHGEKRKVEDSKEEGESNKRQKPIWLAVDAAFDVNKDCFDKAQMEVLVEKQIGHGATANVYAGCMRERKEHKSPECTPVAVKVMWRGDDRFVTECEIAKTAGKYGLGPKVFDYWACDTVHGSPRGFLVTELLENAVQVHKLFDDAQVHSTLNIPVVLKAWDELTGAYLAWAKDTKMRHGDLHMGNMIGAHDGSKFWVVDYGESKVSEALSEEEAYKFRRIRYLLQRGQHGAEKHMWVKDSCLVHNDLRIEPIQRLRKNSHRLCDPYLVNIVYAEELKKPMQQGIVLVTSADLDSTVELTNNAAQRGLTQPVTAAWRCEFLEEPSRMSRAPSFLLQELPSGMQPLQWYFDQLGNDELKAAFKKHLKSELSKMVKKLDDTVYHGDIRSNNVLTDGKQFVIVGFASESVFMMPYVLENNKKAVQDVLATLHD